MQFTPRSNLDAYLNYAAANGWTLVPVKPETKVPLWRRLSDGSMEGPTADPNVWLQWLASTPNVNFGIIPETSGLIIVDIDIDKTTGQPQRDAWHQIVQAYQDPTQYAPFQVTASGGEHIYFRVPEGVQLPGNKNAPAFGDLLYGEGVQTLVSGSVAPHKVTQILTEYLPMSGQVHDMPAWMLDWIATLGDKGPRVTTRSGNLYLVPPDCPEALQKGSEAVTRWKNALLQDQDTELSGGMDNWMVSKSQYLYGCGCSEGWAVPVFMELNYMLADPMDEPRLRRAVHSGFKYNGKMLGGINLINFEWPRKRMIAVDFVNEPDPEAAAIAFMSQYAYTPEQWAGPEQVQPFQLPAMKEWSTTPVIPGIAYTTQVCTVVGKAGSRKTSTLLALVEGSILRPHPDATTALELLPFIELDFGVSVWMYEDPTAKGRATNAFTQIGWFPSPERTGAVTFIRQPPALLHKTGNNAYEINTAALQQILKEVGEARAHDPERPYLWIIDTLTLAMGDANEHNAILTGFKALQQIAAEYGVAVVATHHPGKDDKEWAGSNHIFNYSGRMIRIHPHPSRKDDHPFRSIGDANTLDTIWVVLKTRGGAPDATMELHYWEVPVPIPEDYQPLPEPIAWLEMNVSRAPLLLSIKPYIPALDIEFEANKSVRKYKSKNKTARGPELPPAPPMVQP